MLASGRLPSSCKKLSLSRLREIALEQIEAIDEEDEVSLRQISKFCYYCILLAARRETERNKIFITSIELARAARMTPVICPTNWA